jgi:hypothetical protein
VKNKKLPRRHRQVLFLLRSSRANQLALNKGPEGKCCLRIRQDSTYTFVIRRNSTSSDGLHEYTC